MEALSVLIIEDKIWVRRALCEFLQSAYPEATCHEVSDGTRVFEACLAHNPRLVLLDLTLPGVSGLALIGPIRMLLPTTAVIVVSQHATRTYVERALAEGASAYVAKDRIYHELLPAVRAALADPRSPNTTP